MPMATPKAVAKPTSAPAPARVLARQSTKTRNSTPQATNEEMDALVEGNTEFALDLYRTVLDSEEGNLFFSPYSISLPLAMAYSGASGETERQMAEVLGFGLPQERLHPAFNALDLSLTSAEEEEKGNRFQLNVANSVWGQQGHGFLQAFLDTLAVNYGKKVREVDFKDNSEGARVLINEWVAGETEERIKNLIPPDAITRYTRLVLASAIYFNAAWQSAFNEAASTTLPFHRLDGTEIEAPMMRQQATLGYDQAHGYQAVELPYEGGNIAMTILLPDSGNFTEFEESISADSLDSITQALERHPLMLTMPKFDLESSFSLSETLEEMGMANAFDEKRADFSGIDGLSCVAGDDKCLLISDVLHKAFVTVDEAGTEAAAATAVIIGITKSVGAPEEPIRVIVDRPFLFLIRDRQTGTILFLGRVLQP